MNKAVLQFPECVISGPIQLDLALPVTLAWLCAQAWPPWSPTTSLRRSCYSLLCSPQLLKARGTSHVTPEFYELDMPNMSWELVKTNTNIMKPHDGEAGACAVGPGLSQCNSGIGGFEFKMWPTGGPWEQRGTRQAGPARPLLHARPDLDLSLNTSLQAGDTWGASHRSRKWMSQGRLQWGRCMRNL